MYELRWGQRSRVSFALSVFLPFVLGDGAFGEARAEVPPPYYDCQGEQIEPEDYQALLEYWAWLHNDVYVPVFGPGSPYPACEVGIVLQEEPSSSLVVGEQPPVESPEAGPKTYQLTNQVSISGHRVTEDGGLPILLDVVHYVPLDDLASEQVPAIGVVAGVLRTADSSGAEVPVMGLVTTLVFAPADPETELGCCLPDGEFTMLPAAECTAQGGSLALLGPLGDGDGDGVDDACTYCDDRLTFLTLTNTLTADELAAFAEYEDVLLSLAAVPFVAPAELQGDRGDGGGVPLGMPAGSTVPGSGHGGGDSLSGGTEGGGTMSCIQWYRWCTRSAALQFASAMQRAKAHLAICLASASAFFLERITVCGLGGPAVGTMCAIQVLIEYVILIAGCLAVYKIEATSARDSYRSQTALCRQTAQAMGCNIPYSR